MKDRIRWFERTFDFNFPVALCREILERLRGTPARVAGQVRGLPTYTLTLKDGDTWSIQENVGHLFDLEPLWIGRLDDILDGQMVMREADLTNRKTHQANHNACRIEEVLESFSEARAALVARLDALDTAEFGREAQHPRLKVPMRLVDLSLFIAEHDDYHLARIRELRQQFSGHSIAS